MSDKNNHKAQISVVIITMDKFEALDQLVQYLAVQTVKEVIEIVIVCPSEEDLELDPEKLRGFAGYQIVSIGPFETLHGPRVAGIHHGSAPIVAYTEDHCFPAPGWAEALIKAHEGPWAAVGPIVSIANPVHYRAWGAYFMQYGPWVFSDVDSGGESDDVAGHNSSYKRRVLMEYGDELDKIMVFESVLHEDLRDRGYKLYVEPRAHTYHVFITKFWPYMREHYYIGRLLAATRMRRWTLARRLVYFLGSPLIPFVRLYRIIGLIRKNHMQKELLPGLLPPLCNGLVASAIGEMMGYAFGVGHAAEDTVDLDMNRWRYVTEDEKAELWSGKAVQFSTEPPQPGQRLTI